MDPSPRAKTRPPLITVVIPSRDNAHRLGPTLDSIAASRINLDRVEVIVIDDGSSDGTYEKFSGAKYPFKLQVHKGNFGSQSAATNAGLEHASGELILFSASDIIFHEDLLAQHLQAHGKMGDEIAAVLGYLPYLPSLDVSPFMFYLVNGGFQFAYYLIRDPLRVPPNFTYAPNFSIRRSTLEAVPGFDEQFPFGCQDTDFGIRLVQAGVRIVYNADAVGFHNHPVEFEGFFKRQVMAGEAMVALRHKHPDYEGGTLAWDLTLNSFLAYPKIYQEFDMRRIATIEEQVKTQHPDYQELWIRAFNLGETLDGFTEMQRTALIRVQSLFRSYNRVLEHYWAKGFLQQSLKAEGPRRVEEILNARLSRTQISLQSRRVIEARMAAVGLACRIPASEADVVDTHVIHDVTAYDEAMCHVRVGFKAGTAVSNLRIMTVVEDGVFDATQMQRLEEATEVVHCSDTGQGIAAALAQATTDSVTLRSPRGPGPGPKFRLLSQAIFSRVRDAGILCGQIEDGAGMARVGFVRDHGGWRAQPRGPRPMSAPVLVDAPNPELMVVRRSVLEKVLADGAPNWAAADWHLQLAVRIDELGYRTYCVPGLVAEAQTTPAAVPV